jgi:hypothetical protein
MVGHALIRRALLALVVVAACGGSKKVANKPHQDSDETEDKPARPPETEADRAKKRHELAVAIIPEGSTCLPLALKDDNAPRLELAAVNKEIVVCAMDTDRTRLLGPIGCWKVGLDGSLTYQDAAPLPGRDIDVRLDGRCARGFCLPKDAQLDGIKVAHIAWNLDGSKVAVLAGDDVHVYDASSKAHESSFTIRGDKGVTDDPVAIHFLGDTIFVEGQDDGPFSAVWQFKADGTPVGPLVAIGSKDNKPLSTYHGSFTLLEPKLVGISERGFSTFTTFDTETGKRTKAVRKVAKPSCKADEIETYWKDGDKVTDRCRDSMSKLYGAFQGADAFMGSKSLLLMLRGDRLGELVAVDPRSLAEKKVIKMPWCQPGSGGAKSDDKSGAKADDKSDGKSDAKKAKPKHDDDGDDDD